MPLITDFLKNQREAHRSIVEKFLKDQHSRYGSTTPLFNDLFEQLIDYSLLAGKWHRPTLALVSYEIATGKKPNEATHKAATSLELLHRYLLIHDDIIDRDLIRHSGPTLEKYFADCFTKKYPGRTDTMYSKGMAIVAGDLLGSLSYQMVLESGVSDAIAVAMLKGYNQLLAETTAGWQLQTEQNYQSINHVTESDFTKGMELVSAQYSFVWPLRIGQILAGKLEPVAWSQALDDYGHNLGIAFQIQDDMLGMFGKEADTGKPVGHDYREGKKTLLVLKAYQLASASDKAYMKDTLGTDINSETLNKIRDIITTTGSLEANKQLAIEHAAKAKEDLEPLPDSPAKTTLLNLANYMITRSS